jgi:hypothetical protein
VCRCSSSFPPPSAAHPQVLHHVHSLCSNDDLVLPMSVGTLKVTMLSCPAAVGAYGITMGVTLADSVPALSVVMKLSAVEQNEQPVFCQKCVPLPRLSVFLLPRHSGVGRVHRGGMRDGQPGGHTGESHLGRHPGSRGVFFPGREMSVLQVHRKDRVSASHRNEPRGGCSLRPPGLLVFERFGGLGRTEECV